MENKYKVVDKHTRKVVYSSNERGHAEIYRNTCSRPFDFVILSDEDKVEVRLGDLINWETRLSEAEYEYGNDLGDVEDGIKKYINAAIHV